jgi:aryl-alcohol dehydrogenase-like predicted oxidoreductase
MEYRRLGRTGLKVSPLCMGTMNFGWTADEAAAYAVFDAAADAGINFIDTADIYSIWADDNPGGVAEEYVGKWLKKRPRNQFVIATKARGPMGEGPNDVGLSRQHILDAVDASLKRMQTDYIDLYQVHAPDEDTPLEETMEVLNDLVRWGKVRYIGCSNYEAWRLCKSLWISDVNNWARFDCLQPHYNLVYRDHFERELMRLCKEEGVGVIPYSPLAGGFLTGKYRRGEGVPKGSRGEDSPRLQEYLIDKNFDLIEAMDEMSKAKNCTIAQLSIAWQLANPQITSPIIGANTVEQLDDTLGCLEVALNEEEKAKLDEISNWK